MSSKNKRPWLIEHDNVMNITPLPPRGGYILC